MQNEKLKTFVAKKVAGMLEEKLVIKANTTSCILWYEPKAPEALARYHKGKK